MKKNKKLISAYIDREVLKEWDILVKVLALNKSQFLENKIKEFNNKYKDKVKRSTDGE